MNPYLASLAFFFFVPCLAYTQAADTTQKEKEPVKDMNTALESMQDTTDSDPLFRVFLYSDAIGYQKDQPNGQVQTEFSASLILSPRLKKPVSGHIMWRRS